MVVAAAGRSALRRGGRPRGAAAAGDGRPRGAPARGVGVGGRHRRGGGRPDAQHGGVCARRREHRPPPRAGRDQAVRAARGVAHGAVQPHLAHDSLPRARRRHTRHTGQIKLAAGRTTTILWERERAAQRKIHKFDTWQWPSGCCHHRRGRRWPGRCERW